MINNTPNNHRLDDFLMGKLSAEESSALEAQLSHDSQLQEELFLQRDIIHGLQDERRAELKARLNQIEVGGGGFTAAAGLKIAAIVALVGMFGVGSWYFYKQQTSQENQELAHKEIAFEELQKGQSNALPAMPVSIEAAEASPEVAEITATSDEQASVESPLVARKKVENKPAPAVVAAPKPNLEVQRPQLLSDFEEADTAPVGMQVETPVDALARNRQFGTTSIDVNTIADEKHQFHYQFFDSKLFIYGNFGSKPYEILEINTDGTARYFLFFEQNYYGLRPDQEKITRLRKITNEKLIQELDITRIQKN